MSTLENEAHVLVTVPPFTVLDPPQIKILAAASERIQIAPGEVLVAQGKINDAVFVILEGTADVSFESAGHNRIVRRLVRHAFFGEVAFLEAVPRTATVTATSDLVVLKIDGETLLQLIAEVPALADSIAAHKSRSGYVYD
jgi:putative ABC transport system ATP-binding protein